MEFDGGVFPTGGATFDGGRLREAAREIGRERDGIRCLAEAIATPSDQDRLLDALSAHVERIIDHGGRLVAWRETVPIDSRARDHDGDILRDSVETIEASRRQIADALDAFRGAPPVLAYAGTAEIFDEFLTVIDGIVETLSHRVP